jgi:hypothetical protein
MTEKPASPFPNSNYPGFRSDPEELTGHIQSYQNQTCDILRRRGELEGLFADLAAKGFRRFGKLLRGSKALVLEGPEHQMIRICSNDVSDEGPRPLRPYMIQPLKTIDDIDGYRIEILPRYHTVLELTQSTKLAAQYGFKREENEGEEELERRISGTLQAGCWQLKDDIESLYHDRAGDIIGIFSNVAVLHAPEGGIVFKVVDPGAVRVNQSGDTHDVSPERDRLEKLWREAEENHIQSLGLERGTIKDVMSDDELNKWYGNRPKGLVADLVQGYGLYPQESQSLMSEIGRTYEGNGSDFGDYVRKLLKQRYGEPINQSR